MRVVWVLLKVLGPVEVSAGDQQIRLAGQKQRALCAGLALDFGKAVPVARLVDLLWDTRPPASARAKVQDHVSALRHALGQDAADPDGPLVTRPPGYLLNPHRVALDLAEFTELAGRGRAALDSGQWTAASQFFATALGLWCGTAFADVVSPRITQAAAALEERRLLAVEAKAEADLACGRNETVVGELTLWLAEHPLRERLRALLMVGLYGLGCRAEALALYRAGRQVMVSELGLEPGAQLSRLHERILADDLPAHTPPGGRWPALEEALQATGTAGPREPRANGASLRP
jgi:DNA-binding SARP family transcriptional activator